MNSLDVAEPLQFIRHILFGIRLFNAREFFFDRVLYKLFERTVALFLGCFAGALAQEFVEFQNRFVGQHENLISIRREQSHYRSGEIAQRRIAADEAARREQHAGYVRGIDAMISDP